MNKTSKISKSAGASKPVKKARVPSAKDLENQKKREVQLESFRRFLQDELDRRIEKNPRYSLRAFALALGLHAPSLSHIIRGKRNPSPRQINRILKSLNLTKEEKNNILSLAERENKYSQVSMDQFALISEWHHWAILELMSVKNFQKNPVWIARSLGITTHEVEVALDRLKRLKMIQVEEDGRWTSPATTTLGSVDTSSAHRCYQKNALKQAIQSIDKDPAEIRSNTSLVFSIAMVDLPKIRQIIDEFEVKLAAIVESNPVRDEVYQLKVALFPLSRIESEQKKSRQEATGQLPLGGLGDLASQTENDKGIDQ